MERVNMLFDNEERHYLVYVPDKQRDQIDKIVIGLHGYTGSATGFEMETTGGFNTSADKYNFIAIYPQGSFFYEQKLEKGKIGIWKKLTISRVLNLLSLEVHSQPTFMEDGSLHKYKGLSYLLIFICVEITWPHQLLTEQLKVALMLRKLPF